MKARGFAIALCAAVALVGPLARADEAATATPVERAVEIYKRANALYDAGKLEDAEKLYREAWQLAKGYDIASNLGAVTFDRGKYRDAAEYLSYALASFPAGGKPAERTNIQDALKKARAHVGALKLQVNVPRARLSINGKAIGDSPLSLEVFVDPGSITVAAELDGYEPAAQTIEAKAGEAREVTLALAPKQTPPVERSMVGPVVAFGVGGAGLLLGIVTAAVAVAKTNDVGAACSVTKTCPNSARGDYDSALALSRVSTVGFAVAGVGAAVGLTLVVLQNRKASPTTSIVVGPAFVGVKGAF